jgi:hypothetical protein
MGCRLRPSSFARVTLALSATAFCHIYFKLWAALDAAPNQTPDDVPLDVEKREAGVAD